jgi:hypothetical protein
MTALVGGAFLLGLGASGSSSSAGAQEATSISTLFSQALVEATASGYDMSYGFENFTVPTIAQGAVPLSTTTLTADPNATGLASLVYPGPLLANLGAVADQSSPGAGEQIPKYPIVAEASSPGDRPSASEANGAMRVETDELGAVSVASYTSPLDVPQLAAVLRAGSIRSSTSSVAEAGSVVARARSVITDFALLDGLVTIDSITTDLVAQSDAARSGTSGGTTVSGVRFLGLDAVLDADGLRLAAAPGGGGAPGGGLGGVLGAADPVLEPVTEQLAGVMQQLTGRVGTDLDPVLAQAGISMRLLRPDEVVSGAQASRTSNGVLIESTFDGSQQQALTTLVDLVPPDARGAIGPVPNPVSMLTETHLTSVSLGAASVGVNASPPFPLLDIALPDLPAPDAGTAPLDGGFEQGLPALGGGGGETAGGGGGTTASPEPIAALASTAVPALAVALLVLGAPFFAAGSSRLADNVLSEVVSGCPEGRDKLPAPEG